MALDTGLARLNGLMGQRMKVIGTMDMQKEKEYSWTHWLIGMKETSTCQCFMEEDSLLMWMDLHIKVSGSSTKGMDAEQNYGLMGQNMKDSTRMI